MSRLGNKPITIPIGVSVDVAKENQVSVKGPKGNLSLQVDPVMILQKQEKGLAIALPEHATSKADSAKHGLWRMLIQNMVIGVHEGYKKSLEIVGVGYKANVENNVLEVTVGKSHAIYIKIPNELTVTVEVTKGKKISTYIHVEGIDKALVGQFSSKIREQKKPEPYISKRTNTQKGICYVNELLIGKLKKDGK